MLCVLSAWLPKFILCISEGCYFEFSIKAVFGVHVLSVLWIFHFTISACTQPKHDTQNSLWRARVTLQFRGFYEVFIKHADLYFFYRSFMLMSENCVFYHRCLCDWSRIGFYETLNLENLWRGFTDTQLFFFFFNISSSKCQGRLQITDGCTENEHCFSHACFLELCKV